MALHGVTYDFISGEANLWLNRQSVLKMNIGKEIELATQDEVRIGAVHMEKRYFRGRITAVQVYGVALKAEQIKAMLMFAHTKSLVRMGVNVAALVTATPVLVLKGSREKKLRNCP